MAKKISVQNEGPANWRKSNTLHITSNLRVNVKNIERNYWKNSSFVAMYHVIII